MDRLAGQVEFELVDAVDDPRRLGRLHRLHGETSKWNERRLRSGPGQTSAGAARCTRCDRRGSARSSAVDSTSKVERRRARRPPARVPNPFGASPPFRRGCHPPQVSGRESRPGRLEPSASNATTNRNRSCRPQGEGQATTEIPDRRGAFLATTDPRSDSAHALVAGTPRAIARIERARDWQRYVVGKVLQSPRIPEDPDAGAGLVTATAVGARAGEPAARSISRTWRATEALRYASTGLSRPRAACARPAARSMPYVYEIVYLGKGTGGELGSG